MAEKPWEYTAELDQDPNNESLIAQAKGWIGRQATRCAQDSKHLTEAMAHGWAEGSTRFQEIRDAAERESAVDVETEEESK